MAIFDDIFGPPQPDECLRIEVFDGQTWKSISVVEDIRAGDIVRILDPGDPKGLPLELSSGASIAVATYDSEFANTYTFSHLETAIQFRAMGLFRMKNSDKHRIEIFKDRAWVAVSGMGDVRKGDILRMFYPETFFPIVLGPEGSIAVASSNGREEAHGGLGCVEADVFENLGKALIFRLAHYPSLYWIWPSPGQATKATPDQIKSIKARILDHFKAEERSEEKAI